MTADDHIQAYAEMLNEAPGDDAIWEPWKPVVGQRVRIRLSAECDVEWDGSIDKVPQGHPVEFDGLEATVLLVVAWPDDRRRLWGRTHPYGLQFDILVTVATTDWAWGGGYFAACELISLDTDPTP